MIPWPAAEQVKFSVAPSFNVLLVTVVGVTTASEARLEVTVLVLFVATTAYTAASFSEARPMFQVVTFEEGRGAVFFVQVKSGIDPVAFATVKLTGVPMSTICDCGCDVNVGAGNGWAVPPSVMVKGLVFGSLLPMERAAERGPGIVGLNVIVTVIDALGFSVVAGKAEHVKSAAAPGSGAIESVVSGAMPVFLMVISLVVVAPTKELPKSMLLPLKSGVSAGCSTVMMGLGTGGTATSPKA